MAIEVKEFYKELPLSQDLYATAYDKGRSFSQQLEEMDPTHRYGANDAEGKMDAFQRQLMRFGIRTQDDPKAGIAASRGDLFFQSNVPASRILFPEFLNRVARTSAVAQDDILSQIVARMETITDQGIYRSLYIDDTATQRKTYRVGEHGGFPKTRISWSEKSTVLAKYGVALEMSYEFVRRVSLPLIATVIGRIMLEVRVDEISEAISALMLGDGSGHASGGAIASTNITSYQTDTTPPEGTLFVQYTGYLKWLHQFWPGACTTVLGTVSDVINILTLTKPSTDPIWMANYLSTGSLGGKPVLVNGRLSDNVNFVIHDDITANTLIGLDNRYALIGYRESGTDLTETNKVINGQWDEIVISNTIGFQTLFAAARKRLICVHDGS